MKQFTSSFQIKRQKTDFIKKNSFFHVIDNRVSNVIMKNVYETENVNLDINKI